MPGPNDNREALRADVAVMRELGVLEWNGIKLGPEPLPATETQPRFSLEEQERHNRVERMRVAMASSGGPVKRLGDQL